MIVIYHANCNDGFCAAWLLWRYLGGNVRFHPARYGQEPPEREPLEPVYIVDFSYPRETLEAMHAKSGGQLVVLDHHKTAKADLEGLPYCTFDMSKSGARLTWDWLSSAPSFVGGTLPWLVAYTEDRDLWKWDLPNSREINAALSSYEQNFQVWESLHLMAKTPEALVEEGTAILRYQKQLVDAAVRHAVDVCLPVGGREYIIKVVNSTVLFSDIAGELAKGGPFGMTWFRRQDGLYKYSLRSTPDGVDVSEIAKAFGGGGRPRAAGFESVSLIV